MSEQNNELINESTNESINIELDLEEIKQRTKLNETDMELKPVERKRGRKKKVSVQDLDEMEDEDVIEFSGDEIQALYEEFSDFVQKTTGMVPDIGIKNTVPTGLDSLDAILGGGFALGALNVIVGNPGVGKSMIVMQTMGASQKKFGRNIFVSYLDSEHSTTIVRLANLGVKDPKIRPYCDITVERFFKFLEAHCIWKIEKNLTDKPSIIGWDSIANTLTEKEIESENINEVIGYKARIFSILIPKYVAKCAKANISVIAVNQLSDIIGMGPQRRSNTLRFMSFDKDMPGGRAIKFNAFQLIEMKQEKMSKDDVKKYGFEGLMASVSCVKNKLFRPNIPVKLIGDFTTGYSNFWTNYVFLIDKGRMETGSYKYLIDLPNKKFRNTKDAEDLYHSDEEFRTCFDKAIAESINKEIIEPNTVNE